jgi:hypothetical protein
LISVLLLWLYIFFLAWVFGSGLLRFASRWLYQTHTLPLPPPPVVLAVGLGVLSALLGYISLFFPIGLGAHLLVIALVGFICFRDPGLFRGSLSFFTEKPRFPLLDVAVLLSFLGVLLLSLLPPSIYDTGLYHAQSVRWIEEYAAVPGLGNLHLRLAINSSWSLLNALFGMRFLGYGPFYALNGFLTLVFLFFLLGTQVRLLSSTSRLPVFFSILLLILSTFYILRSVPSIDPDQPVALLLILIFLLLSIRQAQPQQQSILLDYALVFLSIFAVTVKLSALPVILIPAYLVVTHLHTGSRRFVWLSGFTSLFIFLPWLLRNITLSGYLLYPLAWLDLFAFDWQIPPQLVAVLKAEILAWARVPHFPAESVLAMPFIIWLRIWFGNYGLLIHLVLLVALLGNFFLVVIGFLGPHRRLDRMFLPGLFLTSLAYWFTYAPDYRFALGFLFPAAAYPIAVLFDRVLHGVSSISITKKILAGSWLVVVSFIIAVAIFSQPLNDSTWLRPKGYQSPQVHLEVVDGFAVYVPNHGDQCWDATLPCTPYPRSGFQKRGDNFQQGFSHSQSIGIIFDMKKSVEE